MTIDEINLRVEIEINDFPMDFYNTHSNEVQSIKLNDLLSDTGGLLNLNDLRVKLNLPIPNELYDIIYKKIKPYTDSKINDYEKPGLDIARVLSKKKIKAKLLRKYMNSSTYNLKKCVPTRTRYSWCDTQLSITRERNFFKCWSYSFLPMNIKNFIFKFCNNMLTLNAQRARMNRNQDLAPCTFCTLDNNIQNPEKEKSPHLFRDCPKIQNVKNTYLTNFFNRKNLIWENNFSILGAPETYSDVYLFIINIEIHLVNFFLFNCRGLKKLPTREDLEYHLKYYRDIMCFSKRYKREWVKWDPG